MRPPIAFIVGYGPGVGAAVARRLKNDGFFVAVASRRVKPGPDTSDPHDYDLGIRLDMAKPEDVGPAFSEVEEELGRPPSLVVYNAAAYAGAPGGRSDPLSLSFNDFQYGVSVTGINAFQVAKYANAGFDRLSQTLSSDAPKAFVAVGNVLPWYSMPQALGSSAGKRVLANIVEASASAYGPLGKRFYYAYEVNSKGGPVRSPDPATHADVISQLYKQKDQGQWDVRFAKGLENQTP
ncbi:hypothetical protein FRB94_013874 [Tulasnella sp. JGI-2019a]|nr:hypothetical protein FRB94_013874 [Tulasnella sp. JGI-2019a]KAG9004535.1 hypothetical protein FRB93_010312 [Tulasnella sp. JGI-2019a]KAG9020171.1 hypothetical protein FRB95_004985 [Tulasnella sp. JGI-2019a]